MIAYTGRKYFIDNDTGYAYHCQDVDMINKTALIGVTDKNGIVWESDWVSFERLTESKDIGGIK